MPSRTANSIHVMKMCQGFSQNGHKVILFGNMPEGYSESIYSYYGVENCFRLANSFQKSIGIRALKSYIEKVSKNTWGSRLPDLFYGRDLQGLYKVMPFNKPIILEAHRPIKNNHLKNIFTKLIVCKNFRYLVVISNSLRKYFLKHYPYLPSKKILVAHDGADLPNDIDSECAQLKGRNTGINVGYIGHLYSGKSMEIISHLALRLPEIDFHVVGGTDEDINYWKSKVLNIKNIIFYGYFPHGQLASYYKSFDIMLAPYQKKVFFLHEKENISPWMSPLKIFEYMSFSKTIIASDLPVLREVLNNNVNCILCSPTDIDSWAKAIKKLENNQELRSKLATTAYEMFVKKYTWKQRANKIIK